MESSIPVTSWFRKISKTFPLITLDPVPVLSPEKIDSKSKPILFIIQGHPGRKWASRDPQCLAWQMDLLFRGLDFDCIHVPYDYNDPSYPGEGLSKVPLLLDSENVIIEKSNLYQWANSIVPYSNEDVDISTLESLIKGPLLAGVLLELVLLPEPKNSKVLKAPFFTRQLQFSLAYNRKLQNISKILALQDKNPLEKVPGWQTSFHGLLDIGTGKGGNDDDEQGNDFISLNSLDQEKIRKEACEAIQVIAILFNKGDWIGKNGPNNLDANLFAQLHTILSLPISDNDSLRKTVESFSHLVQYSKRIWLDFVKSRGG